MLADCCDEARLEIMPDLVERAKGAAEEKDIWDSLSRALSSAPVSFFPLLVDLRCVRGQNG